MYRFPRRPDSASSKAAPLGQVVRERCHIFPRADLTGDKLVLPTSFLKTLTDKCVAFPFTFKVSNETTRLSCFAGALEFSADANDCYAPVWLFEHLQAVSGAEVVVAVHRVPRAEYALFQPDVDIDDLVAKKGALETLFSSQFTCLTKGAKIVLQGVGDQRVALRVIDVRPPEYGGVLVVNTDLAVDFLRATSDSSGSVDASATASVSASACGGADALQHAQVRTPPKFSDRRRLDGTSVGAPFAVRSVAVGETVPGFVPANELIYLACRVPHNAECIVTLESLGGGDADLYVNLVSSFSPPLPLPSRAQHAFASVLSAACIDEVRTPSSVCEVAHVADAAAATECTLVIAVHGYTDAEFACRVAVLAPTVVFDASAAATAATPVASTSSLLLSGGTEVCDNCAKPIPQLAMRNHTPNCHRSTYRCPPPCDKRMPIAERAKHEAMFHTKLACTMCNAAECAGALALERHQSLECSARTVQCALCSVFVPLCSADAHAAQCGARTLQCRVCHQRLLVRDKQAHMMAHGLQVTSEAPDKIDADAEVENDRMSAGEVRPNVATLAAGAAIRRLEQEQVAHPCASAPSLGYGSVLSVGAIRTPPVPPPRSSLVADMPLSREGFQTAEQVLTARQAALDREYALARTAAREAPHVAVPLNFKTAEQIVTSSHAAVDAAIALNRVAATSLSSSSSLVKPAFGILQSAHEILSAKNAAVDHELANKAAEVALAVSALASAPSSSCSSSPSSVSVLKPAVGQLHSAEEIVLAKSRNLDLQMAAKAQEVRQSQERAAAAAAAAAAKAMAPPAVLVKPAPLVHTHTLVRVRLPGGAPPSKREFSVDDTLQAMHAWVQVELLAGAIPAHKLRLASADLPPRTFASNDLAKTLHECGLVPQASITVLSPLVRLVISNWAGEMFDIELPVDSLVMALKRQVHAVHAEYDIARQKLMIMHEAGASGAAHTELDDARTLSSYHVVDDQTLHLFVMNADSEDVEEQDEHAEVVDQDQRSGSDSD